MKPIIKYNNELLDKEDKNYTRKKSSPTKYYKKLYNKKIRRSMKEHVKKFN